MLCIIHIINYKYYNFLKNTNHILYHVASNDKNIQLLRCANSAIINSQYLQSNKEKGRKEEKQRRKTKINILNVLYS